MYIKNTLCAYNNWKFIEKFHWKKKPIGIGYEVKSRIAVANVLCCIHPYVYLYIYFFNSPFRPITRHFSKFLKKGKEKEKFLKGFDSCITFNLSHIEFQRCAAVFSLSIMPSNIILCDSSGFFGLCPTILNALF